MQVRVYFTVSGHICYSSLGFLAPRDSCLAEKSSSPAHLVLCLDDADHWLKSFFHLCFFSQLGATSVWLCGKSRHSAVLRRQQAVRAFRDSSQRPVQGERQHLSVIKMGYGQHAACSCWVCTGTFFFLSFFFFEGWTWQTWWWWLLGNLCTSREEGEMRR